MSADAKPDIGSEIDEIRFTTDNERAQFLGRVVVARFAETEKACASLQRQRDFAVEWQIKAEQRVAELERELAGEKMLHEQTSEFRDDWRIKADRLALALRSERERSAHLLDVAMIGEEAIEDRLHVAEQNDWSGWNQKGIDEMRGQLARVSAAIREHEAKLGEAVSEKSGDADVSGLAAASPINEPTNNNQEEIMNSQLAYGLNFLGIAPEDEDRVALEAERRITAALEATKHLTIEEIEALANMSAVGHEGLRQLAQSRITVEQFHAANGLRR